MKNRMAVALRHCFTSQSLKNCIKVHPSFASLARNSSIYTAKQLRNRKFPVNFPQFSHALSSSTEIKSVDSHIEEADDKLFKSIVVECRGTDKTVLNSYAKFATSAAGHLNITVKGLEFPRHHANRFTLLKSVFVHKKHRVQYEVRTYFAIMSFSCLTGSTASTFLEYIQRNLPEGVSMKVTQEELLRLPKYVEADVQKS